MSIAIGDPISYSDLTTAALEGILGVIVNKSTTWYNNLPACFKSGYDSVKHTHTLTYTPFDGSATNIVRKFHIYSNSNFNYYFTDETTARNMITSNFNAFLLARGIDNKNNKKIMTTGILNFYNNLAAYTQKQICVVCSHESDNKYICFNMSAVDTLTTDDSSIGTAASNPNITDTQAVLTDSDITNAYQGAIAIIANNVKDKQVVYTSGWTDS